MDRDFVGVVAIAGAFFGCVALLSAPTHAQSVMPGVDEFAAALAEMTTRRWVGPRVDQPDEQPRPASRIVLESTTYPLAVHAARDEDEPRLAFVLRALESAYELMQTRQWRSPPPDGGRGGTAGFDLYLVAESPRSTQSFSDGRILWSHLDRVSAFATVDRTLSQPSLVACATDAYLQALLLAHDPAENESWRRATAAWLTHELTGDYGCDGAIVEQQREPHRSWIAQAAEGGAGGALLLTMLSDRYRTDFVQTIWEVSSQRTWEGIGLRAAPDLWMALEVLTELAEDPVATWVEDFAVSRFFIRDDPGATPGMRDLPAEARVPLFFETDTSKLPRHSPPHEPPLEPFGSAYARIHIGGAPAGTRLRVWLRGEYGVRWSLATVRLDAQGRDLGRMSAPPREHISRSYLPLELTPDTDSVLIVVTNLSSRLPDADGIDMNARSFRLIVDIDQIEASR